jgi:hypothetical protein
MVDAIFDEYGQTPSNNNAPNLSHLISYSLRPPPQFVLVPGFETLSLFLVASALGDCDGISSVLFFGDDWLITPTGFVIKSPLSLAPALTRVLQFIHHLSPTATLNECLSRSEALSDRSPTLLSELRTLHPSLFAALSLFPRVLSGSTSTTTFDSLKRDLDLHFFTTEAPFDQTLIFCDSVIGGPELTMAFSVYPGREPFFRDGHGRLRSHFSAKQLAIIKRLHEDGCCEDVFCLWALGTIDGRPTLALFLEHVFYFFSDRTTVSYGRELGHILTQLRLLVLCYATASSVGVCFQEIAPGAMSPEYAKEK